jgi:hypothetical protein
MQAAVQTTAEAIVDWWEPPGIDTMLVSIHDPGRGPPVLAEPAGDIARQCRSPDPERCLIWNQSRPRESHRDTIGR